ncbi:MAG: acyl carrier protein [Eubacterium sp.]|nr:acyl carrier protein [Eubacterium sp.]
MKEQLIDIICEVLEIEKDIVTDEKMLVSDLGAGSLAVAKIAVKVEDFYDVLLEDESIYSFEDISVKDFCHRISNALVEQGVQEDQ